ncbi:hypothetical protein [Alkalispirochaeta americana]|nr:hypothetical protein [Alkalispirochaeta americana]
MKSREEITMTATSRPLLIAPIFARTSVQIFQKFIVFSLTAIAAALTYPGCSALPELPDMIDQSWDPPVLKTSRSLDRNTLELTFNRSVNLTRAFFDPPLETLEIRQEDNHLFIRVEERLKPGSEYWIDALIQDDQGNTASILASFYGHNPDIPRVLINEIAVNNSTNNPEFVELRVFEAGNLGGLTLYNGSPRRWTTRKILPEIQAEAEDYVIVHFRPQNIPDEVDEITDKSASGGRRSHPEAWDLWVWDGDGLPTTSGGITLTAHPDGPILDAFLYSNRTYDPACPRRGFGTLAQFEIFQDVVARGGWEIAGAFVVPDDGVDPSPSTATRSINRDRSGINTRSKADWHIVPTRGATPGTPNSEDVFQP